MQDYRLTLAASARELAARAVEIFVSSAGDAVDRSEIFTVAFSGGTTPRDMHRMLAAQPVVAEVPWTHSHIFWVDERCVVAGDPRSNFGTAWQDFLSRIPVPRENLHPIIGESSPEKGAADYELELLRCFRLEKGAFPAFDLIFLGMGEDGHTASLFPGDGALLEARRPVVAVRRRAPELHRVTMTLPVLNRAKRIVFMVTGSEKAQTVRAVLSGESPLLPAGMVRPSHGELLWLLDRGAASRLEKGIDQPS
jgi:6-phosphogluconolactonase